MIIVILRIPTFFVGRRRIYFFFLHRADRFSGSDALAFAPLRMAIEHKFFMSFYLQYVTKVRYVTLQGRAASFNPGKPTFSGANSGLLYSSICESRCQPPAPASLRNIKDWIFAIESKFSATSSLSSN